MRLTGTKKTGPGSRHGVPMSEVVVALRDALLPGSLAVPAGASGIVVFAHGTGSSRFSPRNRAVAGILNES